MTLTALIDVAIGLIFTYLLLGLITSALQESVAAALQWRGKALRDGLRAILQEPQGTLFARVFTHALIQPPRDKRLPSYVPSRNFAAALTDALLDGSNAPLFTQVESSVAALPNSAAKQALTSLLIQAGGDYAVLKKQIEGWFENAMDRVSGVYKRRAHAFALIFGFAVALVFNVDSISIARTLWVDPQARALISSQAQSFVENHPDAGTPGASLSPEQHQANAEAAKDALKDLPIPLGWPTVRDGTDAWWGEAFFHALGASNLAGFWKLAGLSATALAVSLGAPFWFDLLQKFFNVRATGPVPQKTKEEPAA